MRGLCAVWPASVRGGPRRDTQTTTSSHGRAGIRLVFSHADEVLGARPIGSNLSKTLLVGVCRVLFVQGMVEVLAVGRVPTLIPGRVAGLRQGGTR